MIETLRQHLPEATAAKVRDDFSAISRLLVRGLITSEAAKIARERLAASVEDMLLVQANVLKEYAA